MTTHYVAFFTVERSEHGRIVGKPRRMLQAACGQFVEYPRAHSVEPTCAECLAYLTQERVEDLQMETL